MALAATAGLKASEADVAIDDILKRTGGGIEGFSLPKAIEHAADARKIVEDMLNICRRRIAAIA